MTAIRRLARDRILPLVERLGVESARIRLPWGASLINDIRRARLVGERPVILDVGANIGQSTFLFKRSFSQCRIEAFEPCHSTYEQLVEATSKLNSVQCHELALGDHEGEAVLKLYGQSVLNQLEEADSNDTLQQSVGRQTVKVSTIDRFLEQNPLSQVDLLKIDTEGNDLAVLRGAVGALERRAIRMVYCEVGFGSLSRYADFGDIRALLSEYGFQTLGFYQQVPSMWLRKEARSLDYCNALFALDD